MADKDRELSKEEISEFMFIQYISMLTSSGMQYLGKIANPMTGKIEKNLEAAQGIIELLSILKERTKGNLTKMEEGVISDGVANLQLNYADEVKRSEKQSQKESQNGDSTAQK